MDNVTPTSLWRSDRADWWGVQLHIPQEAEDVHFCFTDGNGTWDSNFGANYALSIQKQAQSQGPTIRPRTIAHEEGLEHAGGMLHVLTLTKRDSGDKISDRNAK